MAARRGAALAAVPLLLLAGCGGDDDADEVTTGGPDAVTAVPQQDEPYALTLTGPATGNQVTCGLTDPDADGAPLSSYDHPAGTFTVTLDEESNTYEVSERAWSLATDSPSGITWRDSPEETITLVVEPTEQQDRDGYTFECSFAADDRDHEAVGTLEVPPLDERD